MDTVQIGHFIAQQRKAAGLTQAQLAERLNITDRAVSKWETGKSLPDTALMPDLCSLLHVTLNDLFNGEVIDMEKLNEQTESTLLRLAREKEAADRRLLTLEIVIGIVATLFFFTLVLLASLAPLATWQRVLLIVAGLVVFLVCMAFCTRIEQTAGYYRCDRCGHEYIPTYGSVFIAMHFGRTRYMKCPQCGKHSWQKKVLRKE